MGRLYVASVLISLSGKGQSPKVADEPLQPIVPGAWAAWAKGYDAGQVASPAASVRRAPVPTLEPAGSKA